MTRLAGCKGAACALLLGLAGSLGCTEAAPTGRAEALVSGDADLAERLRPLASAWEPEGNRLVSPGWRSGRMGNRFEVGARLPGRADGVWEVGIGRSELHTLRLQPEGALPASAALDAGRVVFRGAYPATDALYVSTPERVEVFFLLGSRQAPSEFRWRVELPQELPQTKWEPSGALLFADRGGTGRLRVPRPFALDARGARRDAELSFTDGVLAVRLDTNGLTFPVLLDPAIENVVWEQKNPAHVPPARYGHGLVYDSFRGVSVLFGGNGGTARTDTWEWDGTDWTQRTPGTSPGVRYAFGMAYDSARHVTVLQGGESAPDVGYQDTWEYNGTTWTSKGNIGPKERWNHALAYDSARGVTVFYGGIFYQGSSTKYNNDTWEWNGSAWSQKANHTYYLDLYGMAYDATLQRTVLFGGEGSDGTSWGTWGNTWLWDGTAWTLSNPGPSARDSLAMAHDSFRGQTVLFGGALNSDTWEFASATSTWAQRTPPTAPTGRNRHAVAFDSARRRIVMFGGWNGIGTYYGDTWEYHTRGGPCIAGSQCETFNCVDGACCESASCGPCQACNLGSPGTPGVCSTVTNAPDSDTCTGNYMCDALGACKLVNGQPCGTNGTLCASGFCADGMCCNAACNGPCDQCVNPGYCVFTAHGSLGSPSCSPYVCSGGSGSCPTSCGTDADCAPGYLCNGTQCMPKQPIGSACSSGENCNSTFCANGVCCDAACAGGCDVCTAALGAPADGTCTVLSAGDAGQNPSCSPYLCDGTNGSCPTSCTDDSACGAAFYCGGDGSCRARRAQGQSCNLVSDCAVAGCRECASGNCVDGYCCDTACDGGCDVCNATPGTCTPVAQGGAGNPSCSPYVCSGSPGTCPGTCSTDAGCATGYYCSGNTCVPKLALGTTCTLGNECISNICKDDVCCDSACAGTCQGCNLTGRLGQCNYLAPGSGGRPPGCGTYVCSGLSASCPTSCTTDAACSTGNYCNGSACVPRLATGTVCTTSNQCVTGFCTDGRCCDSPCSGGCDVCSFALGASANGLCTVLGAGNAGQNPSCSPRVCNGTSADCPGNCTADSGCASGYYCDLSGQCLATLPNGSICSRDRQCTQGHCVDSYCCDTACGGQCDTCAMPSHEGSCQLMAAGTAGTPTCDPFVCSGSSATCPTSCTSAAQCAPGYTCTGGLCVSRKPLGATCNDGTDCKSSLCVDGVCCDSPCSQACDVCNSVASPGVCVPAAVGFAGDPSCSPYVCNGTAITCPTWCTTDTDCATGRHCIFGACLGLQPLGASCGSSASCASGNCYDGVCCDMQCDSACMICNKAGSVGSCSPAPNGSDPRFMCPGTGACKASCGAGGLCAYPDATTACGTPATCTGPTTLHRAWACDGHGNCADPGSVECTPYLCATPACPTSCTNDTACTPEAFCDNGSCGQRRLPGSACTRDAECESGHCVDGICCLSTCGGACQRCDWPAVPGAPLDGICRSPVGADPDGDCTGEGLCAGSCDADGACAFPGPDALCDTCKACDRAGGCSQFPPTHDDPACLTVICGALSTECRTYQDLEANRCVAVGLCARPNNPETCTAYTDAADGTPCSAGVCFEGSCVPELPDGGQPPVGDGGTPPETPKGDCGCRSASSGDGASLALLALLALGPRRRRR
ncbi:MAG: hypothetical protein HY906_25230 [Deltaproteobacteria bacterium]|nr:hypothetical protein [Deltaproteobacteria bacterium]